MAVPIAKTPKSSLRQLVFGINESGRTTHAFNLVATHSDILYVGCAKNGTLDINLPKSNIQVITLSSWVDFEKKVLAPARQGELTATAIIIDDYDTVLEYLSPIGETPTQQQWGIMTGKIVTAITILAAYTDAQVNGRLVVTTTLADDEETGKRDFVFNPSAINRLKPKFNTRHYCYATKGKKDEASVAYNVQTEKSLALKFVTNSK